MPARDLTSRDLATLGGLREPFLSVVRKLLHRVSLHLAGDPEVAMGQLDGWRSPQRQLEKWVEGREIVDGKWTVVDWTKVVSRAPPGSSPHEYGEGLDIPLVWATGEHRGKWLPGGPPRDRDRRWEYYLGAEAEDLGLEWGGRWDFFDGAHVESKTWEQLRAKRRR